MKKLLAISLPAGLLMEGLYFIAKRFLVIPDPVAYPMMVISILLMLTGVAYLGFCFGKYKNPYDFKK